MRRLRNAAGLTAQLYAAGVVGPVLRAVLAGALAVTVTRSPRGWPYA